MEKLLYEASVDGNVTTLLKLLQEDPLILDRASLHSYDDMPLHVSSMLGHIEFVKEILIRKPQLALESDSQRRLPLHIASAKGHVEVVRALVLASPETCLARDRDGRNPVHLAAFKGRLEVVKELVQAQPHAGRAMVQQETILHLCVKHNQLEILKFLVDRSGDHEFINSKDADGNTILHLAVADKQIETVNFLLLDTTMEVNVSNTNGDTPMDILAQGPRNMKDQQIIQSLTRAGVVEMKTEGFLGEVPQNSRIEMALDSSKYNKKSRLSSMNKKHSKNNDDWLDKKRNTLMVVASLIATMAFQAGINPPSGVWQDSSTTDPTCKAGYAVMVYNHPNLYNTFLVCNTVGFVSTLSIILLLISGLPFLRHRVFLWILMVIMWIATSSMSITYLVSIWVLTPKPEAKTFKRVVDGIVLVWIGLMTLLFVGHTIHFMKIYSKLPAGPRKKTILSRIATEFKPNLVSCPT